MSYSSPIVSICSITYAHKKFIKESIYSVLNQKTNFEFEFIIADDNSPDNTEAIISDIITNHPRGYKIKYTKHAKNIGMSRNFEWALKQCTGKYIALCEGDDYWTDPYKLQKQVDFLEKNHEYSMCCGGYLSNNLVTGEEKKVIIQSRKITNSDGFEFNLDDTNKLWITKTLTIVFRKNAFDFSVINRYKYFRDIHFIYHLMLNHKGYYFRTIFGIYNVHPGGVNSLNIGKINTNAFYDCFNELYTYNRDEFTRVMKFKSALSLFNFDLYHNYPLNSIYKKIFICKQAFFLIRKPIEVIWFINSFIPASVKSYMKNIFLPRHSNMH